MTSRICKRTPGLFVCGLLIATTCLAGELSLPAIFSDGMVLQQKTKVPVWGKAAPKASVKVGFGGQEKEAAADDAGRWQVKLDALNASSEPASMTITSGKESHIIKDVLVGEVWLCSGQSNMAFTLSGLTRKTRNSAFQALNDHIVKEAKTAADPLLRHFGVERATSAFKKLDTVGGVWISSNPEQNKSFTATGYYFGRELRRELKVPVGLIMSAWGGTRVEPWIPETTFQKDPEMAEYYTAATAKLRETHAKWDQAAADAKYEAAEKKWQETKKGKRPQKKTGPAGNQSVPATLFNAMIHPLIPYAIKGTIWYQGESNQNHNPNKYEKHFRTLITSWRTLWDQGDFPFYFAQLASFKDPTKDPVDTDNWTLICEQQRRALGLKNTGMAVLNDIGDAKDIHPKNKIDVGKRLALWALNKDYGKDIPAWSGPLYKSHDITDSKVIITFDHVGSGLMTGSKHILEDTKETDEPLKRFQICGKDRQWKWAEARITGKDTVEVSHPEIAEPTIVRYAWAKNPEGANLYNKEGLPASVFTTEKELPPAAAPKPKAKGKGKKKQK